MVCINWGSIQEHTEFGKFTFLSIIFAGMMEVQKNRYIIIHRTVLLQFSLLWTSGTTLTLQVIL